MSLQEAGYRHVIKSLAVLQNTGFCLKEGIEDPDLLKAREIDSVGGFDSPVVNASNGETLDEADRVKITGHPVLSTEVEYCGFSEEF